MRQTLQGMMRVPILLDVGWIVGCSILIQAVSHNVQLADHVAQSEPHISLCCCCTQYRIGSRQPTLADSWTLLSVHAWVSFRRIERVRSYIGDWAIQAACRELANDRFGGGVKLSNRSIPHHLSLMQKDDTIDCASDCAVLMRDDDITGDALHSFADCASAVATALAPFTVTAAPAAFSATAAYLVQIPHQVFHNCGGYWVQTGGRFVVHDDLFHILGR